MRVVADETKYTALAWRNQAFGSALDFAWASHQNPTDYAIRESSTSVKLFKKLKESGSLDVGFQAEGLCGGALLGVKGQGGIGMFDWETGSLVRRIEVDPREVALPNASNILNALTETHRSTGLSQANSSPWHAPTRPMSSASTAKHISMVSTQAKSMKMVLKPLSLS